MVKLSLIKSEGSWFVGVHFVKFKFWEILDGVEEDSLFPVNCDPDFPCKSLDPYMAGRALDSILYYFISMSHKWKFKAPCMHYAHEISDSMLYKLEECSSL